MSGPIHAQLADGRILAFPEGTSSEVVQSTVKKVLARKVSPEAPPPNPSEGELELRPFGISTGINMPQGLSRVTAGAGKAFTDMGRGIGQLVGAVDRKDVDEARKYDAPLMATDTGLAGDIAGNVFGYGPLAALPGAASIAGSGAIGALTGAMQPVGEDDSRLVNAAIGGGVGALVPAAFGTARAIKAAAIDPFTKSGKQKLAAEVLRKAAQNPDMAAERMAAAQGVTPGFNPTAGQAARDSGISSLESAAKAKNPVQFSETQAAQRDALVGALRKVAGSPEAKAAAFDAREQATNPLYDLAKKTTVQGDDALSALLNRPSMIAAQNKAQNLAAERGESFSLAQGAKDVPSPNGILDQNGMPIVTQAVEQQPAYLGSGLHDLKMGLDDAIGNPGLGGLQGAERSAAINTKKEFLKWVEQKIPAYGEARTQYSELSKPINQMDIGKALYEKFVPALADTGGEPFESTAKAYAKALRGGDDLAADVTGMQSAKLAEIMSPEQMTALQGVAQDSASQSASNIGGASNKDLLNNIVSSHIKDQVGGIPSALIKAGEFVSSPFRAGQSASKGIYSGPDEAINKLIVEFLRNPQEAAVHMRELGLPPSMLANGLRGTARGIGLSIAPTAESK